MKTYISVLAALLGLSAAGALTSCGDRFQEEYPWLQGSQEEISNDDEEGLGATDVSVLEKELKGAIPFMINYTHEPTGTFAPHKYQYQRANNIDNYAGYWTVSKGTFTFGGPLPTLYYPDNDYLSGPLDNQLFQQSKDAIYYAESLGKPAWRAIALIIQGYLGHELVDFYGALPFTEWRQNSRVSPLTYEPGADVYNQIFEDLDEAIATLKREQPSRDDLALIEDLDQKTISQGDWRRWVKFANSLKLRMAMNIVNVDAGRSQTLAEEAVNDEIGVLTEGDLDIAYYYLPDGMGNCLYQISVGWNDLRLGASLENILKHFNHPGLTAWFDGYQYPITEKNAGITADKDIYGVRQGIAMSNTTDTKSGYGPFGITSESAKRMPQPFLKVTEVLMLRAEGALRGWNMGSTAQDFYERAIRLSFSENAQYGGNWSADAYLAQDELPVVDYVDPYNWDNNIAGRVSIGVKWNDADDQETKLEKIITQKYLCCFPLSAEAWTTFRRTSYPRLFPVVLNPMYPDVDYELQLRRMPLKETTNNALEMASLSAAIGGPQNGGTRVFWDNSNTWTRGDATDNPSQRVIKPNNF